MLKGLGEGIFEGTACVADGVPSHLLGTVEVAQSHIVEALEEGDVDAVHPAHAGLFALADPATNWWATSTFRRAGSGAQAFSTQPMASL